MAVIEDTTTVAEAPAANRRRRQLIAVTVGVLVLVLVLGGAAWQWRTHPDVFPGAGNGFGAKMSVTSRPTMYLGLTDPDPDSDATVTIDLLSPHLMENSAGASFVFYVCHGSHFIAASPRDFEQQCPDPVPVVRGTKFDTSEAGDQQLVMGVTVHRSGLVRARGADITYSNGWQHGTQTIGLHIRFVVR